VDDAVVCADVDWEALKQEIREAAPSLGIDKIRFASADPFVELRGILERHRALGRESGFEEPDLDKRTRPELSLRGARSIIAVAVAYPSKLPNPPKSEPGARRGIISRSAWGEDYHRVLRDRLSRLDAFVRERVPWAETVWMSDTGVLVDRAVAERAGIGWIGKNCSIITPEFGSWVFLGEMITNLPFSPDEPVTEACGSCTKCIDFCPTGALVGPGQLDAKKCLSFLTQTKGPIDDEYKEKMGNRLYGCDTCQIVCPHNRGKHAEHHSEFRPDPEKVKPLLIPLLSMNERAFREAYGASAASWRGRKPIQRNAVIALGNWRDPTAVPHLARVLREDPRPVLRGTAAWALGKIGGDEALRALEEARAAETDAYAVREIERAIARLKGGAGDAAPAGADGQPDRSSVACPQ